MIREKEERDFCSFRPNINCTKYLDAEGYQPIEKRLDCIRVSTASSSFFGRRLTGPVLILLDVNLIFLDIVARCSSM